MAPYPPTSEPTGTFASPVTASIVPPIPCPTYGSKGLFSVLCMTTIAASPATVLAAVRGTTRWKEWNNFFPACQVSPKSPEPPEQTDPEIPTGVEGDLELGLLASIPIFIRGDGLDPSRRSFYDVSIQVTSLEQLESPNNGFRISWRTVGTVDWNWRGKTVNLLRNDEPLTTDAPKSYHSERVMEMHLTANGSTEFRCWETIGGLLAMMIKGTYGATLCERNGDFARDLKGFVEKKGRDGTRKSTSAESGRSGSASGSSAASGRMWKGKSRG